MTPTLCVVNLASCWSPGTRKVLLDSISPLSPVFLTLISLLPLRASPFVGCPFVLLRYKTPNVQFPRVKLIVLTPHSSTTTLSMSSAFFTTVDGDVILRAGQKPGSRHDFRVHKLLLSCLQRNVRLPPTTRQLGGEIHHKMGVCSRRVVFLTQRPAG